jgi:hypothetical protein
VLLRFIKLQIYECRMTNQVPRFVQNCSANSASWSATDSPNTCVAAGFESEKINWDGKQTGLLVTEMCGTSSEADIRTDVFLATVEAAPGGAPELYFVFRRTQFAVQPTHHRCEHSNLRAIFNSLFVLRHNWTLACHVPNRTVAATALLIKKQF